MTTYYVKIKTNYSLFASNIICIADGLMNGMRWFQTTSNEIIEYPIDKIQWVKMSKERLEWLKMISGNTELTQKDK